MITRLYVNGCSWANGDGTATWGGKVRDHCWPTVLARKLNIPHVNQAAGGGSNARMYRMTIDYVLSLPPEERKNLLVIIGWSTIERGEIYVEGFERKAANPDDRWFRFNAQQPFSMYSGFYSGSGYSMTEEKARQLDKYHQMFVAEVYEFYSAMDTFLKQVVMLKSFLRTHGVKFLFFSALPNLESLAVYKKGEYKPALAHMLPELIDTSIMNLNESCMKWVYDNKLELTKCIHPTPSTHVAWADHMVQELKARGILGDDHAVLP